MNKNLKAQAIGFMELFYEAHGEVQKYMDAGESATVSNLLADCQESAISLGSMIEESEGEGFVTVHLLEDYCELLYKVSTEAAGDVKFRLDACMKAIEQSIKNDIPVRREVVFMPYKADMWDSLESVWRRYDADADVDAYVVPIPYYDKNPDGSYRDVHYDGSRFPEYVKVTDYNNYDLKLRHPDEIYIHNPYDEYNLITTIAPEFYSKELKKHTDKLIYIPYFVLGEPDPDNEAALEGMEHFVVLPGVINADEVIVQSEAMRQAYINILTKKAGEGTRQSWEEKIKGYGSPKFDRIEQLKKSDVDIPPEWEKYIKKEDGTDKKVILYNTSVSALLEHGDVMLKKMRRVFEIFRENEADVALLWRPHPLIEATISSMRPRLWDDYQSVVADYKEKDYGIYDDSADLDRAIAVADAYYGDPSSLVQLCQRAKIPVMIQAPEVE